MRSPTLWLALVNLVVAGLAGYVGLRLEPLYNRMQRVEQAQIEYEKMARGTIEDYIAFKAQTIEIMRQQNEALSEIKDETRRLRNRP